MALTESNAFRYFDEFPMNELLDGGEKRSRKRNRQQTSAARCESSVDRKSRRQFEHIEMVVAVAMVERSQMEDEHAVNDLKRRTK